MEKDDEIKGVGNSYDFGARILDPRIGRWLSIDPLAFKFLSLSTYNFAGNSPIYNVDPDGKEIVPWWKSRSFLGFSWTSYETSMGWNDVSGGEFSRAFTRVYNFNRVFISVIRQLDASEIKYTASRYKASSNYIINAGEKKKLEGKGGYYDRNGGITFIPSDISGWDIESYSMETAVFEEFYHAGQHDYYREGFDNRTKLEIEVEAKFAKAYSGMSTGIGYEETFMIENEALFESIRSVDGDISKLGDGELFRLDIILFNFASTVAGVYGYDIQDYTMETEDLLEYFQETAKPLDDK